jgi:hypothetical protein
LKFLQLRALCNSKLNRAVCSVRLVSVRLLVNSVVLVVGIRADDSFQNRSNVGPYIMIWAEMVVVLSNKFQGCLTNQWGNQIIIYIYLHPLLGVDEVSRVSWQLVIVIHSEVDCLILCK